MGFAGKQGFTADMFKNSSSNYGLITIKMSGINKHGNIKSISAS